MKNKDTRKLVVGVIAVLLLISLSAAVLYGYKKKAGENEKAPESTAQQPTEELKPEENVPFLPESPSQKPAQTGSSEPEQKPQTGGQTPVAGPVMLEPIVQDSF